MARTSVKEVFCCQTGKKPTLELGGVNGCEEPSESLARSFAITLFQRIHAESTESVVLLRGGVVCSENT